MPSSPLDTKPWRARYSSSDLALALAGVSLALICALFPWYIFYNQDQFGVRALKFESSTDAVGGAGLDPRSRLTPDPLTVPAFTPEDRFDPVSTGTLPPVGAPAPPLPGLDEQPFPSLPGDFRLIHVANGRAMIEDDRGYWVVQPGSLLPDESRVSSIERRAGRWVLVTDSDRVVPIAE